MTKKTKQEMDGWELFWDSFSMFQSTPLWETQARRSVALGTEKTLTGFTFFGFGEEHHTRFSKIIESSRIITCVEKSTSIGRQRER